MRILFCLAGQHLREQWQKAAALVDLRAHDVTILHVVDESVVTAISETQHYGLPRTLGSERQGDMRQALRDAGQRVLLQALAVAREDGVVAHGLLRTGRPAAVILAVAQETAAEVIILGRQHPGLEGRFLGGVSRFVVDQAPCTVLLLR